ncbi:hypothetical protein CYY_008542 [Polysphondylium violaceum]|uniref:Carbohydrate binding domain-containing protein n=1 Tax=Polysphondylium violaceum TaxID=133409 RepID=A0A8J4PMV5_9MYCE|nr:hypothetical protein CYY_008542 [Polysphondylium violaceum]
MIVKFLSLLIFCLFFSSIQSASIIEVIGPYDDYYGSSSGCASRVYQIIIDSETPVFIVQDSGVYHSVKSLTNGTITIYDVYYNFPIEGPNDVNLSITNADGDVQIFENIATYNCVPVPTFTLATQGSWVIGNANGYFLWYKFISLEGLSKPTEYSSVQCNAPAPFYCQVTHYPSILTSYYFLIYLYLTNQDVPYSFPINVELSNSYGTNKILFPFDDLPSGPNTITNIQVYPPNNTAVPWEKMSDVHFFFDAPNLNVLPSINGGLGFKVNINIASGNPSNASYFALQPVQYSLAPIPFFLESVTKTGATKLIDDHLITFTNPSSPSGDEPQDLSSSSSDVTELGPGFKLFTLKSKVNVYWPYISSQVANYTSSYESVYPYGMTNGNVKEYYHACSQFVGNYSSKNFYSTCGGSNFFGLENPLSITDDVNPSVTKVELYGLDAEKVLIRIHANDDISGIQRVEFLGSTFTEYVTNANIVKGTKMNGVYELIGKFMSYSYNSPRFTIYDVKTNFLKLETNEAIINSFTRERVPRYPIYDFIQSTNLQTFEFTYFQFKYNDVDLSANGINNTLYFNITNAHPSMVPYLMLVPSVLNYFAPNLNFQDNFVEGFWNSTAKLYQIDFYLPPRIFTGKVSYTVVMSPNVWDSSMLESVNGAQSQLRVISSNGDLMPPVVSAYAAYPSTAVNVVSDTQIGWTITIQDPINGLKSATFNITSDYDLEPYTIKVTPANAVSGDKYTGVYNIRIPVSANCRSQSFRISSIIMIDTSGHSSSYPSNRQVNSLYKFILSDQHFVNVTCPASTDITPPTLTSLTMDKNSVNVGEFDQNRVVTFTFTVTDLEGISTRHTPYVYLETSNIQSKLSSKSSLVSVSADSKSATFTSTITLPYGFSAYESMVVSIFGLVDKQLNINGYTALDLKNLGLPFLLKTTYSSIPIVTQASRITSLGGVLTVYGHKFGLAPLKTVFQVDYQNGQGWKNTTTTFQAGIALITNAIQPTSTPFYVRVIVDDNIISNSYLVTPIIVYVAPAGNACGLVVEQKIISQWINSEIYPFTQVAVTYKNTGTKTITGVSFAMDKVDQIWGVDKVNNRYQLPSWHNTIPTNQFYSFGYIIQSASVGSLVPTVTCP